MATNVIIRLIGVVVKFSDIAKVHKYKGLHERHHFILMAMEVHGAPECDMNHFIKECACLFHDRRLGGHLSLSFCIQFFRQCVSIVLQCALAFAIKRKIALAGDACSRPLITIRSHDLNVGNIRRLWVKWLPTTRRTSFLPSLVPTSYVSFGLSLAFPFAFHVMVLTISFYCDPSFHSY